MAQPSERITFSREQIELLDKTFPEVTQGGSDSDGRIRERIGQRSVVQFVRSRSQEFRLRALHD